MARLILTYSLMLFAHHHGHMWIEHEQRDHVRPAMTYASR